MTLAAVLSLLVGGVHAQTVTERPKQRPDDLATDLTSLADKVLSEAYISGYHAAAFPIDTGVFDDFDTDGDFLIAEVLDRDPAGLDEARARGYLRMAVAPDPLMIAFDGEEAIGVAVAIAQEMETFLQTLPGASSTPTVVVPTPMPRSEIETNLAEGRTDFTTLTVATAEENDALSYTQALITSVNDVPILSADIPGVSSIEDLVGLPIYVQENGRYARNLIALNAQREAEGRTPLTLKFVDERLDDYDLIEMVEVGLIPATVASDFKARFWNTVYTSAQVMEDIRLTEDGRIAWAMRTSNPELHDALDGFAEIAKQGTLLGNVILKRYTNSADWIENIGAEEARRRLDEVGPIIQRYSKEYDFEFELVLAQAYQESRLDQARRSHVGAIGVMQVMPATAADPVVGIPDVSSVESNVQAGIKYLRWLRDTFFDDPAIDPLDQTLLSFAAYNAGPGGVKRARARAEQMGLDPNVWFENVEVAIQRAVSREPAIYVRNIFKYYVAYRLLADLETEAAIAREALTELPAEAATLPLDERIELLEEETDIVVGESGPDTDTQ